MKQFFLSLLILGGFGLSACETHKKQEMQTTMRTPVKQDFATLGRDLSDGSVDLYDPNSSILTMPSQSLAPSATPVSPIAKNPGIATDDPSVTIYSLDTVEAREPAPAPLPPLQPPVGPAGRYPSPFNHSGK